MYVKVICDIPVNARTYHEDDDDEAVEELPVASNQSEAEPMEVDDASTGQIISPPSEFEFLIPRQDNGMSQILHSILMMFTWNQLIWM